MLDFSLTDDQESLRALAQRILTEQVTSERLREVEAGDEWLDRRTWEELGRAGLLGVALPESAGGGGLGFLELAIVLEQVGATVAPVPVLASIVTGALPVARFGSEAQAAWWLPGAARGERILTAALQESGHDDPAAPETTADVGRDGWRLRGEKRFVPAAHVAEAMLVPARAGVGVGVFLVDPHGEGVTLERSVATNGEPQHRVLLDGAPGEPLGDPIGGRAVVEWTVLHATAALCVMQVGVSERMLRMTADHVTSREQFGQPIGAFQAVSQRAADAYVDVEAIRLTAWQAAWRLSAGLPADDEVAIAKFWAADGGQRVAHAAQHLHGGVGVDLDYPLHRYFRWSKAIELTLGSATRQLLRLGDSLGGP